MLKGGSAAGIEIDSRAIRAVVIERGKGGIPRIRSVEEIDGPFVKDDEIIEGISAIRHKLGISGSDTVVTCLSGKQAYAAQMNFKKMPVEEMKTALKFEIRKNLSFDTVAATIEYQFLEQPSENGEFAPIIVTAVANALLQRTMKLFEKAGIKLTIVDVFPLTVANTFWSGYTTENMDVGPRTILHVGPDFSTVVLDGVDAHFFNRTIYFSAAEIFGDNKLEALAPRETERRLTAFTEEIARSLTFYSNTYKMRTQPVISVLGGYCTPELCERIEHNNGLQVEMVNLTERFDTRLKMQVGKFEIATILGMRGIDP